MTVEQYFEKLLTSLNLTTIQRQKIQSTRSVIDETLRNHSNIHIVTNQPISFLTGSYRRNTIIRPINDIDLYVRIHYGLHAYDKPPIKVMRLMGAALRGRLQKTKIRLDMPCIVLSFSEYKFEVVPVVTFSDDEDLHRVPGSGARDWVKCYPNVPTKWMTRCNYANDGRFIPLIKILKNWNRNNNVGFKSFHLELLTEMVFREVSEIWSYPQGIYEWMSCVSKWINDSNVPFVLEPGKRYTCVDNYLYEKKPTLFKVRQKLKAGLKQAELAYYSWLDDKEGKARLLYQRMFSKKSPLPTLVPARKPAVPLPNLKPTTPFPVLPLKPLTLGDFLEQAANRTALGSHFNKPAFPPRKEQDSNFFAELLRSYPKKPGW